MGNRKLNLKGCPNSRLAPNRNLTVMFPNNPIAHRQTEARTLSGGLCSKKWIKYFGNVQKLRHHVKISDLKWF